MTTIAAPTPVEPVRVVSTQHFPQGYEAMSNFQATISAGPLDPFISELVKLRASQLNGCAYCLDMHTKDARAMGETDERMHLVAVWRESAAFSPAERAALALAEAITLIGEGHVPADVWEAAAGEFGAEELMNLVWQCIAINAWNRLAITTRAEPGKYRSTRQPLARS